MGICKYSAAEFLVGLLALYGRSFGCVATSQFMILRLILIRWEYLNPVGRESHVTEKYS
jgi:hypothetical protein